MPRKNAVIHQESLCQTHSLDLSPGTTIAVIGAGLAGASVARALAEKGAQVEVWERETAPATQTSAHPAAVVFPMVAKYATPLRRFYNAGYEATLAKIKRLQETQQFQGWQRRGALHLLVNQRLKNLWDNASELEPSPHFQAINSNQTTQLTQNLINKPAFWYPEAGFINPPAFAQALLNHQAIRLHTSRNAVSMSQHADQWRVSNQETVGNYRAVVLANGLDVLRFEQAAWLPLRCLRGQIAYLNAADTQTLPSQVICHEGYLVPNCGEFHLAGATFHPTDRNHQLTQESQNHLLDQLETWLPGTFPKNPPLRGRVAFRTQSPDHLPMVGPLTNHRQFEADFGCLRNGRINRQSQALPNYPRIFVTIGHASRGTVSCWLSGQILAWQLLGGIPPLSQELMAQLHPSRYLLRAIRRNQPLQVPAIPFEELPPAL